VDDAPAGEHDLSAQVEVGLARPIVRSRYEGRERPCEGEKGGRLTAKGVLGETSGCICGQGERQGPAIGLGSDGRGIRTYRDCPRRRRRKLEA